MASLYVAMVNILVGLLIGLLVNLPVGLLVDFLVSILHATFPRKSKLWRLIMCRPRVWGSDGMLRL